MTLIAMVKNNRFRKTNFLAACIFLTMNACAPKGPHKPETAQAVKSQGGGPTFEAARNVFAKRCSRCHNPSSGLANWSDKTTAEAKRTLIATRVSNKSMPQAGSPEADQITANERKLLVAWAQSAGAETPHLDLAKLLKEDRNKARAEFIARCTGCHGASGVSASEDFPNLARHDSLYIENRLREFLSPESRSFMSGQLHSILTEYGLQNADAGNPDVKDLFTAAAAHFSSANPPSESEKFKAQRKNFDKLTASYYQKGEKIFQDVSCASCHLAEAGRPSEGVPMILGQKQSYLLKRLPEEKASMNEMNPMPSILQEMTEEDFKALSTYLSRTAADEVQPAQ